MKYVNIYIDKDLPVWDAAGSSPAADLNVDIRDEDLINSDGPVKFDLKEIISNIQSEHKLSMGENSIVKLSLPFYISNSVFADKNIFAVRLRDCDVIEMITDIVSTYIKIKLGIDIGSMSVNVDGLGRIRSKKMREILNLYISEGRNTYMYDLYFTDV